MGAGGVTGGLTGVVSGGAAPPNQPVAQAMTGSMTITAATADQKRLSLALVAGFVAD